jgi:hypothetical protein
MMLRAIAPDLWVAEKPLKYFGLEVGTRMTIIRLDEEQLIVISPIQIDAPMIDQLNQLGDVSDIIAPNLYHHLFLDQFKQKYPDAKLWATSGLAEKRPDLSIDVCLSDRTIRALNGLEALQANGFNTLDMKGTAPLNEWVFFHPQSRTLVITDLAFYFDGQSAIAVQVLSRLFGGFQQLRPSFLEKLATKDKEQVQRSVQQILDWDFERVIMAHGSIVEGEGKRQFQLGYEWFLETTLSG